jgi:hypothetical protein
MGTGWGLFPGRMKLTTHHLVSKPRVVELYLCSPIRYHGVVHNLLSTGTTVVQKSPLSVVSPQEYRLVRESNHSPHLLIVGITLPLILEQLMVTLLSRKFPPLRNLNIHYFVQHFSHPHGTLAYISHAPSISSVEDFLKALQRVCIQYEEDGTVENSLPRSENIHI